MEIDNNLIYVVKINGQLQKITGKDILLSVDMDNKDIVVMIDKNSNVDDISQAMKIVSDINK